LNIHLDLKQITTAFFKSQTCDVYLYPIKAFKTLLIDYFISLEIIMKFLNFKFQVKVPSSVFAYRKPGPASTLTESLLLLLKKEVDISRMKKMSFQLLLPIQSVKE
jgi:hypothetical protein